MSEPAKLGRKSGDNTLSLFRLGHIDWIAWVAIGGIVVFLAGTDPGLSARYDWDLTALSLLVSLFFLAQLATDLVRSSRAEPERPWWSFGWLTSWTGGIDLLAAFPIPLVLAAGFPHPTARLFGVLWSLKLIRASPAFALLARVIRNERQSLLSVTVGVVVVLLFASTGAYLLERTRPA